MISSPRPLPLAEHVPMFSRWWLKVLQLNSEKLMVTHVSSLVA